MSIEGGCIPIEGGCIRGCIPIEGGCVPYLALSPPLGEVHLDYCQEVVLGDDVIMMSPLLDEAYL